MAFQFKNFTSIVAGMINHGRAVSNAITDWNPGSVARTLVEAPAIEISELYQQIFNGLREAIPVSIYNSFDFPLLSAVAANGYVTVNISQQTSPQTISAGDVFTAQGAAVTYTAQSDVVIPTGSTTAQVFVAATTPGTIGNIPGNQSFTISSSISGFVSATNTVAFINGRNQETQAQRKSRFADYIQSLSRGTIAALEYGAKTSELTDANGVIIETVQYANVVEPYVSDSSQPIAYIQVYIHNGSTGASSALESHTRQVLLGYRDNAGNAIPGWKAAGVHMDLFVATNVTVAVTATVTIAGNATSATVISNVDTAINNYLSNLAIGENALVADLYQAAMSVTGVVNFVPSAPSADVVATNVQKLVPGAINLTAA